MSKYTFNIYSFFTFFLYVILILAVAYIIIKILQRNFGQ